MSAQVVAAILSAGVTFLSAALGVYFTWEHRAATNPAEAGLEQRLDQLAETMKQSSKLIAEVELELSARASAAARLKEEAATAEALAQLAASEREAVARLVREEIGAESRKSFRAGLAANFLFFVAGAGVSVLIDVLLS